MRANEFITDQGVAEGLSEGLEQIPATLYHATYKPRLKNIKLKGLGAGGKRNWEDSQRGVIYLALDPNVAESYAETSDMVPDEWLDQIVILKISTAGLDPNKFQIDSNVQDNAGDTVEYHGVIPTSNISLYKQGVAEGMFDRFKKKPEAKPQYMPITAEQRAFIKQYFPTNHNADITWGRKDSDDYVLPNNVTVHFGKGLINFINHDGKLIADVAFHHNAEDRMNPKASPLIHFDRTVTSGEDLEKLKNDLSEGVAEARGLAPTKPYDDLMANMGYFMSLNTVKIQQDAVDNNAQQELDNMQQQFRKPILNGMSFFDVNRDMKISKNPKVAPILLKYVYDMLGYIEPRIKKYIKPEQQGKYLDRLNQIKNDYRGAVAQVS